MPRDTFQLGDISVVGQGLVGRMPACFIQTAGALRRLATTRLASMEELTPGWRPLAVVAEGDRVLIQGQSPWGLRWLRSDELPITVAHPGYPSQRHQVYVYELDSSRSVRFAAGELSAGVWGFYVPA